MSGTASIFKEVTGMSIGCGIVMIVLGTVALFLPLATGIAVSVMIAWLIILGGCAYAAYAFASRGAGDFIWRLLIGVTYIVGGGYLAFHPQLALESFTVVMAVIFLLEGVLETVTFFQFRVYSGSGWILFDAIVSLLLAYLIWQPWPSSSVWAIGTILGVNLIVSGLVRVMYSVAARRTLEALA